MKTPVSTTVLILVVAVLSLPVYAYTAAPSFTWAHDGADGGDLITASVTGGVPHPSGYPTYLLLTSPLRHLPLGELAFRFNLFSGLCAAITIALTGFSVQLALEPVIQLSPAWRASIAAATAAAFAFSSTLWSQAVITEVYTLNVAFAAAVVYLLLRWRRSVRNDQTGRGRRWLALLGFVFGLGLGNHLSLLLLAPGIIYWLWTHRREGSVRGLDLGASLLGLLLGLTIYGLLPLRASNDAIVNWADPRTPQRLWWLVSGRLYRRYLFTLPHSYLFPRFSAWARELLNQFGVWGVALGLLGWWYLDGEDQPLTFFALTGFVLYSLYAIGYDTSDSYVYLLPAWLLFALWLGRGLAAGVETILSARRLSRAAGTVLSVGLLLVVPMLSLGLHFGAADLHHDHEATDYRIEALAAAGPNALIITNQDRSTFALWYHRYALGLRPDVTVVNAGLYAYGWYRRTLISHHPNLGVVGPDGRHRSLGGLVKANLATSRPVYLADEMESLMSLYRTEPAGPLQRLFQP